MHGTHLRQFLTLILLFLSVNNLLQSLFLSFSIEKETSIKFLMRNRLFIKCILYVVFYHRYVTQIVQLLSLLWENNGKTYTYYSLNGCTKALWSYSFISIFGRADTLNWLELKICSTDSIIDKVYWWRFNFNLTKMGWKYDNEELIRWVLLM